MSTRSWWLLVIPLLFGTMSPLPAQRLKLPVPLAELESRVKRDSTDPAAHYNVALGYWSEKRYDDAEQSLRTTLAIDQRFAPARLALAFLPYARRPKLWDEEFDNAVPAELLPVLEESDRQYRQAFMIDPMVDLTILGAVVPRSPDFLDVKNYLGEAYALFFQGFADCQEGRYEDCHGRFVALIRDIGGERYGDRIPNSVLWYKGIAAAHIGKLDIAEEHFRLLMKRNYDLQKVLESKGELTRVPLRTNEYRYTLATVEAAAGKNGDAFSLFQQAVQEDIGLYMAHVRLANLLEGAKDYAGAIKERQRAIDANPDDPSLVMDLGVTLGKAGQFAEAADRFQQALDANPRDVRPLFWLGIADQQLGRTDAARASFERYVSLAPSRYDRQLAMARDRLAQLK